MAIVSMLGGDLEVQIKDIALRNMVSLIADGLLDPLDYPEVKKGSLIEFRLTMDVMFAQFDTDVTVPGLVPVTGASWREVRGFVQSNFELVDAVINP